MYVSKAGTEVRWRGMTARERQRWNMTLHDRGLGSVPVTTPQGRGLPEHCTQRVWEGIREGGKLGQGIRELETEAVDLQAFLNRVGVGRL